MKIHFLECLDKHKLFSFYRHDYRDYRDKKGNYYSLDGGNSYQKFSHPHIGKHKTHPIKEDEIGKLIKDIREQFTWGQNYAKNGRMLKKTKYILLKDLTTDHIIGILSYFTEKLNAIMVRKELYEISVDKDWIMLHSIFIEELKYRKLK
jgi:hypothetical protein